MLVGAGNRGKEVYGRYALEHPDDLSITTIVEPDGAKRNTLADGVGAKNSMAAWSSFQRTDEDAIIIASPPTEHYTPATDAMVIHGFKHVLLEKPMATTSNACNLIAQAARENDAKVLVTEVLRYSPFFIAARDFIQEGSLGELKYVELVHLSGDRSFQHTGVRGNESLENVSGPTTLSKSVHDFGILEFLVGDSALGVISRALPIRFHDGAEYWGDIPDRCIDSEGKRCADGEKGSCPFDAVEYYASEKAQVSLSQAAQMSADTSSPGLLKAIKEGPYGRCIWKCGNDVVDSYEAEVFWSGGLRARFRLDANYPCAPTRKLEMRFENGKVEGDLRRNVLEVQVRPGVYETLSQELSEIRDSQGTHGGADALLIQDFLRSVRGEEAELVASIDHSLSAHALSFAAHSSQSCKGNSRLVSDFLYADPS